MTGVSQGYDQCQDNPLARATRNLFSTSGQPFKRLTKCFFQDPSECIRWFGVFVHSAGDRILFFPGYSKLHDHLVGYMGENPWKEASMDVDHISLEKDRLSWHFTNKNSTEHVGSISTHRISDTALYWFSLSVLDSSSLRAVRENTVITAPIPSSDVDRRVSVFTESREDAVFQLLCLNRDHSLPSKPMFLHFSVLVGLPGFCIPQNTIMGLPANGVFSNEVAESIESHPVRIHRIQLSESIELMIIVSAHHGNLEKEFVFSGVCPG